jgi:hypothetical protein
LIYAEEAKTTAFTYDEDPDPDYGGRVNGWTNTIYFFGNVQIGTSDEIICAEGDTFQDICRKNMKRKCLTELNLWKASIFREIAHVLFFYDVNELGIGKLIFDMLGITEKKGVRS